ncbi:MAG: anthranilate phosphoribosyltransferase [Actinobacteria bacterium]|nr:anthranilate phosphoribosyltransferase [Actinomycetota bacterium]
MTTPAASPSTTWPELLTRLLAGRDLTQDEAAWAMAEIMGGEATPVQVAGFLVALRAKGETVEELHGLADVMLDHALRIEVAGETIDIVGTGGDRHNSVNISTMSGIVLAGAGLTLVKHGNRAASSASGSADVLEALGVSLSLTPSAVAEVAAEAGITFCFAQAFHPAMRHAAVARRELGVGTAFNMLGPLTNPGQPVYAAVGVADPRLAPLIAGVFAARERDAVVFRGRDGLDELTLSDASDVWWVRDGAVRAHVITPEAVGLERAPLAALRGGDAAHNADVARDVLGGARGPVRDAVLMNAGAALALAARSEVVDDDSLAAAVREGIRRAAEVIDSGLAAAALDRWIAISAARTPA